MCISCLVSGGRGNPIIHVGTAEDEAVDGFFNNDHLKGLGGNDSLFGNVGDDTLSGGGGDDLLQGGAGDDVIRGGRGDDVIEGGAGNDRMVGGLGADTFEVEVPEADRPTRDVIVDFAPEDTISLGTPAGSDYTFIGTARFSGTGSEVGVTFNARGHAVVRLDADGDGSLDGRIVLLDTSSLTAEDFVL